MGPNTSHTPHLTSILMEGVPAWNGMERPEAPKWRFNSNDYHLYYYFTIAIIDAMH
jgi:hypothetical protein